VIAFATRPSILPGFGSFEAVCAATSGNQINNESTERSKGVTSLSNTAAAEKLCQKM
jgi:hypothetical protein